MKSVDKILTDVTSIRNVQPDEAMYLVEKAYLLAKSANDIKGQADALKHRGYLFMVKNNFDPAISDFEQAFALYGSINDSNNRCKCADNIGYSFYKNSLADEAKRWLELAENLCSEARDSTFLNLAYSNQGLNAIEVKQYDNAFIYFKKSLDLALKIKDNEKIVRSYLNLALVSLESHNYDEGFSYNDKALSIALKNKLFVWAANCYNNKGYSGHFLKGEFKEAIDEYSKALELSQENDYKIDFLFNLGSAYGKLGKPIESEIFFNQSLTLARKLNNKRVEILIMRKMLESFHSDNTIDSHEKIFALINQLFPSEDKYRHDQEKLALNSANKSMNERIRAREEKSKNESDRFGSLLLATSILLTICVLVIISLYVWHLRQSKKIFNFFNGNARTVFKITEFDDQPGNDFRVNAEQKRLILTYMRDSVGFAEELRFKIEHPLKVLWKSMKKLV